MGTLLSTAFHAAASAVEGVEELGRDQVLAALQAAADGVARRGDVSPGDRTVLDAMLPALAAARAIGETSATATLLAAAATGASSGAEATSAMEPQVGRASWVGARVLGSPDGGAVAWSIILGAMANDELQAAHSEAP